MYQHSRRFCDICLQHFIINSTLRISESESIFPAERFCCRTFSRYKYVMSLLKLFFSTGRPFKTFLFARGEWHTHSLHSKRVSYHTFLHSKGNAQSKQEDSEKYQNTSFSQFLPLIFTITSSKAMYKILNSPSPFCNYFTF